MIKVLTWHVHANYLYYLAQIKSCKFFIPFKKGGETGYAAIDDGFPWGKNIHQVPIEQVKNLELDVILFQSSYPENKIYLQDQYEILSKDQVRLPKIYLEHEPPRELPTDTRHVTYDSNILLVHVTHFNKLMWDSGETPVKVIEHGVCVPNRISYRGDLLKGAVVINNLDKRGRRLGLDIFERVSKEVSLDLIGIDSEKLGGLGEVPHQKLLQVLSRYRFLFNPARYTSLGLSVCEGMMVGIPVVALATTEMATVVRDGTSGFSGTDIEVLIPKMKLLISDIELAKKMGRRGRQAAKKRFGIQRFIKDWEEVLSGQISKSANQRLSDSADTSMLQRSDALIRLPAYET